MRIQGKIISVGLDNKGKVFFFLAEEESEFFFWTITNKVKVK
jgi:hypothetical protein